MREAHFDMQSQGRHLHDGQTSIEYCDFCAGDILGSYSEQKIEINFQKIDSLQLMYSL